jgi:hypothetical protein
LFELTDDRLASPKRVRAGGWRADQVIRRGG